jgi:hypothetical protein
LLIQFYLSSNCSINSSSKRKSENRFAPAEESENGDIRTTATLYSNGGVNEASSLANNKLEAASPNNQEQQQQQHLPVIDYGANLRKNTNETGSQNNVTLSSTSLSNRTAVESTGFKKMDDVTNSAHEFIFNPNSTNRTLTQHPPIAQQRSTSRSDLTTIPASASNLESRKQDAAAPDANVSRLAQPHQLQLQQQQQQQQNLGSVAGGIKVLPTSPSSYSSSSSSNTTSTSTPFKLINVKTINCLICRLHFLNLSCYPI